MNHGSLFSGIGGFDLAAQWMGWKNLFHCEINPFGQRILNHYWPESESFTDITKTDFTKYANRIDVLSGGFPCQPYSSAGKRLGKEDSRHLWPEMYRAIKEISPRWIVGENVRGLTNWSGGLVFDEVQIDLEAAGYEVTPFLLPACAVNAPHRRDRIWFIAHSGSDGYQLRGLGEDRSTEREGENDFHGGEWVWQDVRGVSEQGLTAHTSRQGLERRQGKGDRKNREWSCSSEVGFTRSNKRYSGGGWQDFPTQPPLCGRNDGIPAKLDGITFSQWRNESIKGYGNAVVPQLVFEIFKSIEKFEDLEK